MKLTPRRREKQRKAEKRKKLLEAAGYTWTEKYKSSPLRNLKDWQNSFGKRLNNYKANRREKMKKLHKDVKTAQKAVCEHARNN